MTFISSSTVTRLSLLATVLLLPSSRTGVSAYTFAITPPNVESPLNNDNIHLAVSLWLDNPSEAEQVWGPLQEWDVSAVTDMDGLFASATADLGDLSQWQTSQVTSMTRMFQDALLMDGGSFMEEWDVSSVTHFDYMFHGATTLTADLSQWNTPSALSMKGMFASAESFDSDVSGWNVQGVTNMDLMFYRASSYNVRLCWETLADEVSAVAMFCGSPGSFQEDCDKLPLGYEHIAEECEEQDEKIEINEDTSESSSASALDLQRFVDASNEPAGERGGSGGIGAMNPASGGRNHPEKTAQIDRSDMLPSAGDSDKVEEETSETIDTSSSQGVTVPSAVALETEVSGAFKAKGVALASGLITLIFSTAWI